MDKITSPLKPQIASSMRVRDTDELISIWRENNHAEWSDVAFEVVKELLLERGQFLPEQNAPIYVSEEKPKNINTLQTVSKVVSDFLRNNKKPVAVFCCFLIVGVFWAILSFFNANQIPSILSLKDNWERMEISARSWQVDAYLTNVSFNVAGQGHYPIEAEYHSKNEPGQILVIGVDKMGKIVYLPFDIPSGSSGAQDPIYKQDWIIDSQEALNLFAKREEINTCLVKPTGAQVLLHLNRVSTKNVSWQLVILNCQGTGGRYFLDAKTGEVVWMNQ